MTWRRIQPRGCSAHFASNRGEVRSLRDGKWYGFPVTGGKLGPFDVPGDAMDAVYEATEDLQSYVPAIPHQGAM